ncbi:MAG TPA: LEA type 2 family protein [Gemmatimonadales bacterium]|nr:LEA type 2 family protein [Gemmatimonadales bacterium]
MRFIRDPWRVWWLLPVLACTPLGVWVYQDPSVAVARVRVDAQARGTPPVLVALAVTNPNDYALSTSRLELKLLLDDLPIGTIDRDSSVPLPKGTALVSVPLVPDRAATSARLEGFRSGMHRFTIEGRATLVTPVGKRKVRFAEEGEMAFGLPPLPASAPDDPGALP